MTISKKLLTVGGGERTYVEDVFSTYLHTGNGSTQTITNGIDLDGEGGLVWVKHRGVANNHYLVDTVRGATKTLFSNLTNAESTDTSGVTGFTSTGFNVGNGNEVNQNNQPIASWTFRKQPGFFDVVTYTGTGSPQTISHNLGSVPGFFVVKRTDSTGDWWSFHRSLGATKTLRFTNESAFTLLNIFNNTAPTDSVFTVGADSAVNASGGTYVAYLFAHDAQEFGPNSDESIIKCGSYVEPSSNWIDIDLGFEPQYLLAKSETSSSHWTVFDSVRDATGRYVLQVSRNAAEQDFGNTFWEPTATGFKIKSGVFGINETIIYMAIRRPHKPASEFAATDLFAVDQGNNALSAPYETLTSNFPVDMGLVRNVGTSANWQNISRLTGGGAKTLHTNTTDAEAQFDGGYAAKLDNMTGIRENSAQNFTSFYGWMFRRAPGFFDVVAYSGFGSGTSTFNHNLGVAPELMIIKSRGGVDSWVVGSSELNNTSGWNRHCYLNTSGAEAASVFFNNASGTPTAPTATTFDVRPGTGSVNDSGGTYVAYLFATVPGISKVGSYTGNGTSQTIDCGFSTGARFVLIKRTSDTGGNWMVWDSVRGITSATNDPFLYLNSSEAQAQVAGRDIDPAPSGFAVNTNYDWINLAGSEYIFLAIA